LPFGLDIENNTYNVFKRNQVQKIFYNPEDYKELANTYPNTILTYLTHITGSVKKRDMFCQFLANKLKTHEYSPLIFVLWGVPGSGKNTLTSKVLAPLVEGRDIVNLTIDNLKDKFNSVFKEKDFLVLDEVHTLSPLNKRDFVNLINALSGKQKIAERKMFNSFMEQFDNEFTIIMTTNKPTEVTTEANDRRIVVFRSEKQLSEVFNKSDDEIISRLEEEIYSFAYYLSQLPKIDSSSYTKNYNWIEGDEDYSEFMTESKSYAFRIYKALQTRDYYALLDILFDADILDDEFVASVTKEPRGYALRLTNSKPNIAKVPGLVDHPNLAIKQENIVSELNSLAKEYKQYFMYVDALEYENGVKTGSKKTAYRLDIDKLPDNIKQKIEDKFRDMEPDDLTGADDDK
jgi:Holliday junction resolvasome RuvABC ATP-dependent DNA helicase subunit